jgi:hypothetical protein
VADDLFDEGEVVWKVHKMFCVTTMQVATKIFGRKCNFSEEVVLVT